MNQADRVSLPEAKVVTINQGGSRPTLELQVSIEGRDHNILLPLDALPSFGGTDQAVATELRKIHEALSNLPIPLSIEIANDLFAMIDARYRLPKRETG